MTGAHQLVGLPDWPACLDADEAVKYSRLSRTEISRAVADGRLVFKPIGHNGRKVVRRLDIDELLSSIWSDRAGSPLEDMDFGADDN